MQQERLYSSSSSSTSSVYSGEQDRRSPSPISPPPASIPSVQIEEEDVKPNPEALNSMIDVNTFKTLQKLHNIPTVTSIEELKKYEKLGMPALLLFYPQSSNKSDCKNETDDNKLRTPEDLLKDTKSIPVLNISEGTLKETEDKKSTNTTIDDTRERIHVCPYPNCEKTYFKNSHLKTHIRSHTGKFDFNFLT